MNHKQLVAQLNELKSQMDTYKSEVESLRSKVNAYENVEVTVASSGAGSDVTSRRRMLKRFVAGVAGIGAMGLAAGINGNHTVLAENVADNAIEATSGPGGYALLASSSFAPIRMVPAGAAPAGAHQVGEFFVDSSGNLWYCTAAGTPGTWRKVSGNNAAGAFHALPTPSRFIDTRAAPYGINDVNNPYSHGITRTYNMWNLVGTDSGDVPTGAKAVQGNVTVVSSVSGFLQISPSGLSINAPSTLNFAANVATGNNFTSALDAAGNMKVFIHCPGATGVIVIIDITGYYI